MRNCPRNSLAWLGPVLCCLPAVAAAAQPPVPTQLGKNHALVKAAFAPVIAPANRGTVRLLVQRTDVCLGTVVSADGYVLSVLGAGGEAPAGVVCRLPDGRELAAVRVAARPEYGLALWRIPARSLTPVAWTDQPAPRVGSLLAASGRGPEPVAIGIVSQVAAADDGAANDDAGPLPVVVFSHDLALRPVDCGGPVVGLDGAAVGISVARSSRALSRAVTAAAARRLAAEMIAAAEGR